MLDNVKMVLTLTVLGIAGLAFAGAQPMRSGLGLCWLALCYRHPGASDQSLSRSSLSLDRL